MNKAKAERALKKVAEREGMTVRHIRAEIQKAIDIGLADPDPCIQAY